MFPKKKEFKWNFLSAEKTSGWLNNISYVALSEASTPLTNILKKIFHHYFRLRKQNGVDNPSLSMTFCFLARSLVLKKLPACYSFIHVSTPVFLYK